MNDSNQQSTINNQQSTINNQHGHAKGQSRSPQQRTTSATAAQAAHPLSAKLLAFRAQHSALTAMSCFAGPFGHGLASSALRYKLSLQVKRETTPQGGAQPPPATRTPPHQQPT
jgi:hypothetical protein